MFSPRFYRVVTALLCLFTVPMVQIGQLQIEGTFETYNGSSIKLATITMPDFVLTKEGIVNAVPEKIQISDISDESDLGLELFPPIIASINVKFFGATFENVKVFGTTFENHQIIITALNITEWLSPNLSQVIFLVVMVTMTLMLWWQKEQISEFQKEMSKVAKDMENRKLIFKQINNTLQSQQSSFTNMSVKVAALNKRLDKVSGELEDENADLEKMEDYLNDWKENWKHQSAKLRQINTDNLLHPSNVCRSGVDMMIAEENQKIEGFVRYAGAEFGRIRRRLMDDHEAITSIFDSMEYIHDGMSQNQLELELELEERSQ